MKKFFIWFSFVAVSIFALWISVPTTTNDTNNKQSNVQQEQLQNTPVDTGDMPMQESTYDTYKEPIVNQEPTYTYQEYKSKHTGDKELLELLDLYTSKFNPEFVSKAHSVQQYGDGANGRCIGEDSDVFCSQTLWDSYGIYTNINQEDRDCFCKCDTDYKTDRCILARRNAADEDIGFFDYKFFLPDDLKMSKNRFKQVAKRYKIVRTFKYFKCLDDKLELISTEREDCVKRAEDYIANLSYNKIQPCKKYYMGRCSDEQISRIDTEKAHCQYLALSKNIVDTSDWYNPKPTSKPTTLPASCSFVFAAKGSSKEICEQLKRMEFELDNNCVLKE